MRCNKTLTVQATYSNNGKARTVPMNSLIFGIFSRLRRKVNGCLPSPTEGRILPSEYFARLVKRPASSPSMYTARSRRGWLRMA